MQELVFDRPLVEPLAVFYPHDEREVTVGVTVGGKFMIVEYALLSSAYVNEPSPFAVKGRVQTAPVTNPAAGVCYKDGPAASVKMDGVDVPKGYVGYGYKEGEQPVGTEMTVEGAITYPVAGTYLMSAMTGRVESPLHLAQHVDYIVKVGERVFYPQDEREVSVNVAEAPPVPRLPELLALGAMFFGVVFAGTYLLRKE